MTRETKVKPGTVFGSVYTTHVYVVKGEPKLPQHLLGRVVPTVRVSFVEDDSCKLGVETTAVSPDIFSTSAIFIIGERREDCFT